MSSGGLLLLLGLLTLWAELTPISSQGRLELCYLPADSGPCLAYMPHFYYNSTFNDCQEFIYGGCRGNANRFRTRDQCRYACVEKPGMCPPGRPKRPCHEKCRNDWGCPGAQKCCRYGCATECKDVLYVTHVQKAQSQQPECEAEGFSMSSGGLLLLLGLLTLWAELTPVSSQKRPDFCHLPPVQGPCTAIIRRFYYNPASNKCLFFFYGGCKGNANNFKTKDECQKTCIGK
ncbi:LOW QUALITY PROTEIN: fused toxin protein-like [Thamnophis elegans]|uniref:LOW QUALITY PROTEIN: fused toxin protein-like n=1 Tax=Thamnophis elegans TaxID=35005 RepID=UPI0013764C4C|nr:LOW QUALITY PROTEIN: fused toxin protein-like [Thamnophis elegans]